MYSASWLGIKATDKRNEFKPLGGSLAWGNSFNLTVHFYTHARKTSSPLFVQYHFNLKQNTLVRF